MGSEIEQCDGDISEAELLKKVHDANREECRLDVSLLGPSQSVSTLGDPWPAERRQQVPLR